MSELQMIYASLDEIMATEERFEALGILEELLGDIEDRRFRGD